MPQHAQDPRTPVSSIGNSSIPRAMAADNILDVTLRDGGYLNQWRFTDAEVGAVLDHLMRYAIRHAEIGFLRAPADATSAVNGCPTNFLRQLADTHPQMRLVAMLNPADPDWRAAIDGRLDILSMVRLTCTTEVLDHALQIADAIHQILCPPAVSINLISISSYRHDEIANLVQRVDRSSAIDYLYFADSRGALAPREVGPLIDLARRHCHQSLGFHAHDTRGNAIENSRVAFDHGCELVDVSLDGFGLAGGNTPFAGLLAAAGLADDAVEIHTQAFCARELSLRHAPGDDRALYRALANRNLDPIWAKDLTDLYPDRLTGLLEALPRRTYKTLDSAQAALGATAAEIAAGSPAVSEPHRRCA